MLHFLNHNHFAALSPQCNRHRHKQKTILRTTLNRVNIKLNPKTRVLMFGLKTSAKQNPNDTEEEEEEEEEEKKKKLPTTTMKNRTKKTAPRLKKAQQNKIKPTRLTDEEFQKNQNKFFLSLLVTEGAVKGTIASALGVFLNVKVIEAFTLSDERVVANVIECGLICALPLILADFLIMNMFEDKDFREGEEWGVEAALGVYAREASLNNPCVDMNVFMDCTIAIVARIAETFVLAFSIGFLFSWITERGVEFGYDVFEIEQVTKWIALALVVAGNEVLIYRRGSTRKKMMRAYKVTRDPITGKEKMEEITSDETKRKGGGKDSKKLNAFEAALFNLKIKNSVDNWRERSFGFLLGTSFVLASGNAFAPLVGGLVSDVLFCLYQRNNVRKYIEGTNMSKANNLRTSENIFEARKKKWGSRGEAEVIKKQSTTTENDAYNDDDIATSIRINEMIQKIQKESKVVADKYKKTKLIKNKDDADAQIITDKEAMQFVQQLLPPLITGLDILLEEDIPPLSAYEEKFAEASKILLDLSITYESIILATEKNKKKKTEEVNDLEKYDFF